MQCPTCERQMNAVNQRQTVCADGNLWQITEHLCPVCKSDWPEMDFTVIGAGYDNKTSTNGRHIRHKAIMLTDTKLSIIRYNTLQQREYRLVNITKTSMHRLMKVLNEYPADTELHDGLYVRTHWSIQ